MEGGRLQEVAAQGGATVFLFKLPFSITQSIVL